MSLSTQTFTTQYVTETTTTAVIVSPTLISSDVTITVTSHLASTVTATYGQTITIHSPPPASSFSSPPTVETVVPSSLSPPIPTIIDATAKYTPSPITATAVATATLTVTDLDVYLQNTDGDIYSTWVIPYTPAPPEASATSQKPGLVYVVDPSSGNDWDNWSKGERAGLIFGVILAACLLFGMIWYCCRQSWTTGNWWFASGWPQHQAQPQVVGMQGPQFVQPMHINGPIVPYAYQPGLGYGMRGGGRKRETGRLFSGRNWFSVKGRVPPGREQAGEAHDRFAKEHGSIGDLNEMKTRRKVSGRNWFTKTATKDANTDEPRRVSMTEDPQDQRHVEDGRASFYQPLRH